MKTTIKFFTALLSTLFLISSCSDPHKNLEDGLYAEFKTNKGTILIELAHKDAPITVANFVSLAEGTNSFVTEDSLRGKPFYDNLIFHRVVPNFMIQTGDPQGDGMGGPGYKFKDEINPKLTHNRGGILSMANAGPNTNGSQIFITHKETPFLDGIHSVFGKVITGMETVHKIEMGDQIKHVKIIRKGESAKKFDAAKIFEEEIKKEIKEREDFEKEELIKQKEFQEKHKVEIEQKLSQHADEKSKAKKTASGLQYYIRDSGKRAQKAGETILVNYSLFLENGELRQSSIAEVEQSYGILDQRKLEANGYSPFPFVSGSKTGLIEGFIEGLSKINVGGKATLFIPSHLGYGPQGIPGAIPANANLIFEIEILEQTNN